MTDAQRVQNAFSSAFFDLAELFGHEDIQITGTVDTDQLPAAVVNCARSVMDFLTVGMGLLDADGPSLELDADEFLSRLNEKGTTP